jgi:DNA-binding MarR family transcriptional regulator
VLCLLAERNAISQQDLAEQLGINRTTMVKVIDRLEAAGHVQRVRNSLDRRSYALSLTDGGRSTLADMRQAVRERDGQVTAVLTAAERDRLGRLLRELLPPEQRGVPVTSLEHLLGQVHFRLRHRGDGRLAAVGLRARHFGPLLMIEKFGPCPQQQLAHRLAVTEPATAQFVDELVRAGLVSRGQDPQDRRRYALQLTETGARQLAVLQAAVDELQAEVVECLGPGGNAELQGLLRRLLPAYQRESRSSGSHVSTS